MNNMPCSITDGIQEDQVYTEVPDMDKDELMIALEDGLSFDEEVLALYANPLLVRIADAVRDQVVEGKYYDIDINQHIKETAEQVREAAYDWHCDTYMEGVQ
jgi:hypothetical protein